VFFDLLRFTAPLRAKKKISSTPTWQKRLSDAPLVISIYKKTENQYLATPLALSHGTPVGNQCSK